MVKPMSLGSGQQAGVFLWVLFYLIKVPPLLPTLMEKIFMFERPGAYS